MTELTGTSVRSYLRLPHNRTLWRMPAVPPESLLFIDVIPTYGRSQQSPEDLIQDSRNLITMLRDAPGEALMPAKTIVVRWPYPSAQAEALTRFAELLAEHLRDRAVRANVAVLAQSVGDLPELCWADRSGVSATDGEVLGECRRAELDYFLFSGEAVWRPQGYHYQLPSGRHATTFVRTADALIDPRAPGALATWLYPEIGLSTAIVLDHGGLAPIAQELFHAARASGTGNVGRIVALNAYPKTSYDYQMALKGLENQRVIALLSVSSTGKTLESVTDALETKTRGNYVLHPLVAREEQPEYLGVVPTTLEEVQQLGAHPGPWTTLGDPLENPAKSSSTSSCGHCDDPDRFPLVRIDPRSMRTLLLPKPELLVPDLTTARGNRSLWERYTLCEGRRRMDFSQPIRSVGRPVLPGAASDRQMYFEPVHLAVAADTPGWFEQRIKDLSSGDPSEGSTEAAIRAVNLFRAKRPTHLVLDCTEYDELRAQLDVTEDDRVDQHVRELIGGALGTPTDAPVLRYDEASDALTCDDTEVIEHPLVLVFGLHTGVTLQRTFLSLRSRRTTKSVSGLVVHAHPADPQVWAGIRNTFRDANGCHVLALYLSYLPERTPLIEERRLLVEALPALTGSSKQFALERIAAQDPQPLWGDATQVLRPTSFLGEELPAAETLAAAGSAMHASRVAKDYRTSPIWLQFNLQRTFKSYFDGLILACILRWVRPHEAHWGDRCTEVLSETHDKLQPTDWEILLPELLLAAAQGKLSESSHAFLLSEADRLIGAGSDQRPWLELGSQLLRHADA